MNLHKILSAHKGALGCNITVIAMWNPVGISIPHVAMPAVILWTDGRTDERKEGRRRVWGFLRRSRPWHCGTKRLSSIHHLWTTVHIVYAASEPQFHSTDEIPFCPFPHTCLNHSSIVSPSILSPSFHRSILYPFFPFRHPSSLRTCLAAAASGHGPSVGPWICLWNGPWVFGVS